MTPILPCWFPIRAATVVAVCRGCAVKRCLFSVAAPSDARQGWKVMYLLREADFPRVPVLVTAAEHRFINEGGWATAHARGMNAVFQEYAFDGGRYIGISTTAS